MSIRRFVLQNQQIEIFLAFDNLFDKLALNKTDKRKDRSRIDHFTGLVYCLSFSPWKFQETTETRFNYITKSRGQCERRHWNFKSCNFLSSYGIIWCLELTESWDRWSIHKKHKKEIILNYNTNLGSVFEDNFRIFHSRPVIVYWHGYDSLSWVFLLALKSPWIELENISDKFDQCRF